jgi:hypothetical protein
MFHTLENPGREEEEEEEEGEDEEQSKLTMPFLVDRVSSARA